MAYYKTVKLLLIAVTAAYFGTAFFLWETGRPETYPFFIWMPFSRVPPRVMADYEGRILGYESKRLDSPTSFNDAYGLYLNNQIPLQHYNSMIRDLAAYAGNNQKESIRVRQMIEKGFLTEGVIYGIARVEFDVLERWKTGAIISENIISTFKAP